MKLNKILMALAATAIVGCTSEDVNDFSAKQAPEDSRMIELNENFVLAGVGEGGVATRTHWEQDPEKGIVNKFLPILSAVPSADDVLANDVDPLAQAVGLCWRGETPGADVYTNYQFYHFGWLKKGETEADVDNCIPFKLYNGALYDEIKFTAGGGVAGEEADETDFTLPAAPIDKSAWELNYNSGVYKTDNKTIFGGQYIVYYPYNPDFQERGAIPAKAVTSFDWDIAADTYESAWLGEATFRYSAPVEIDGGMKAANFGLYNLSTLVRLRVFTSSAGDAYNGDNIDQVVLYSPSGKFVKQAYLGADKIAAGQEGADLYADFEPTKTITTNFITTATTLNVKATTTVKAYITVLPTTVDDLVALVHNADEGFWYRVELPATEFEAGHAQVVDITVKESDITSDFIAVDDASLRAALTEAEAEATESNPVTIKLFGDVTLTNVPSALNINQNADRYITIDGGDIIVPQDVTLTLTTLKEMKSTVRVLGKDCCTGAQGGRLVVTGADADPAKDATILNNVTLEKTEARVADDADYDLYNPQVTYQGTGNITIAEGKKVTVLGGNVNVDRDVQHKGDIEIAKDGKVNVSATGSLSFLGSTVDNYGTIEVAKAGQFYMKNANGTSVWTDGQKMTNHATGKFIHNVDAVVGTAVQFMNQETGSEYRCRVDKQKALDDAYIQWTACSVIEMVNSGAAITYDLGSAKQHTIWNSEKYVDIEVNNTDGVNPPYTTTFKKDGENKEINIGNLTVMTPLDVDDKENTTSHAQRSLKVNGNMTVSANTQLLHSKKVTVTGNLDIDNKATLTYAGNKAIVQGLDVTNNITVTDAIFDAAADGGILISCKNFSLINEDPTYVLTAATFGNRTAGDSENKTMEVKGTISNGKGCTFTISPAAGGNLLAWITCYKTEGEGTYAGTPTVVQPAE